MLTAEHHGGLCDTESRGRCQQPAPVILRAFSYTEFLQRRRGLRETWRRAGVAGTTTHPSSTRLPNAHVIFRGNTVDEGTKEVKERVQETAKSRPYLWNELI